MLRISQSNSNISTYEDMEGAFYWNKILLAALGIKTVVYAETSKRPSWGPHARDAFYIGRAPLHYRFKILHM